MFAYPLLVTKLLDGIKQNSRSIDTTGIELALLSNFIIGAEKRFDWLRLNSPGDLIDDEI